MRGLVSLATVVGLLLLASALSGETRAHCTFVRLFNSSNPTGYSYLYTPGVESGPESTTVTEKMQGAFWMLGYGVPGPEPGQGIDNGRFEAIVVTAPGYFYYGWVRGFPYYGAYIQGPSWASSPDIDPCPDIVVGQRCMAILLTDEVNGVGYFAFLTDEADGSQNYDFVQPANGPINLIQIPKPAILGTVFNGNSSVLGLLIGGPDLADLEGGLYLDPVCLGLGDVVGYKIYSLSQPSGSPPPISRDRALWTAETGTMDFGTTFTLTFDCSGAAPDNFDIYLALGLVFESGFELQVSRNSSRVACGPIIAEPDDLDLKPRRKPGRKTKR